MEERVLESSINVKPKGPVYFASADDGIEAALFPLLVFFSNSEGGSCLLAQQRSKASRSLQCLWLCSSGPAAR